ncbi:MAG: Flp family type IVb pilin [Myxococcales bacterium]|nr:Flp family type IVb pilin [Myxococcales bacterium]
MFTLYIAAINTIAKFHKSQAGATTSEYIIIVALIAIAVITVTTAFGDQLIDMFTEVTTSLDGVQTTPQ